MSRPSDIPLPIPPVPTHLARLVRTKKVIVVCGAGGVGKTTTAAAIGMAGALFGRKTLVLTIDPARRLAEAMGIPETSPAPTVLSLTGLSLPPGGELSAWMLDPAVVFETMIRDLSETPEKANRVLESRLYGHVSKLIAGMQEYTAAEGLYAFAKSGRYDLVVLDTPPSRNALEFLEAPRKLSGFLDERVVSLFMPKGGGGLLRAASSLVSKVFSRIFGAGFFDELKEFVAAFSGMFGAMREHSIDVRALLTSHEAGFVLVTSPEPSALAETRFFRGRMRDLGVPLEGTILNRSYAYTRGLARAGEPPPGASADLVAAFGKLGPLAELELGRAERDRGLLAELVSEAEGTFAIATPHLGNGPSDVAGIVALSETLVGEG